MQKTVVRAAGGGTGWVGVEPAGYRPGEPASETGVARHTILGARKTSQADSGPAMEVRYFELQPGAASRLEKHEHEHYVIVRDGIGYAILDDVVTEIGASDVVYVAPMQLHQFVNRGERPFGFFCMVPACRDFSQQPTEEDLARLASSPAGAVAKPFAVPPPQSDNAR